jgi:hypothetical protein
MSFVVAAVGVGVGVMKLVGASKAKKAAAAAQKKAQAEMDVKKKQYEALDTSNLAANQENKMEDLTINQKGMNIQSQKSAQSRSNIMAGMNDAAGGSGIAALAQTMANQGAEDAQKSGSMIGDQEAANQKSSATEASKLQTAEVAQVRLTMVCSVFKHFNNRSGFVLRPICSWIKTPAHIIVNPLNG